MLASLNIELHRLSIWRDIDMAAREIADLMQDTLVQDTAGLPLYSSADTASTVQERCLENRHRTYLMQSMMRRAYNRAVCTEVGAERTWTKTWTSTAAPGAAPLLSARSTPSTSSMARSWARCSLSGALVHWGR